MPPFVGTCVQENEKNVIRQLNLMSGGIGLASLNPNEFIIHSGNNRIIGFAEKDACIASDERFMVVFYGELFNASDIKNLLQRQGISFSSKETSEIILKAFAHWGKKALEKFRGPFSIAILDKKRQKLLLVRDRLGIKPIYYYHQNSDFIFSSSLKGITRYPNFKKQLNPEALSLYMKHGYVPSPLTIYSHTYKLKAATMVEVDIATGTTDTSEYWDLTEISSRPKFGLTYDDAKTHLKHLLMESIQKQFSDTRSNGILISGGTNSSLLAALIQSQSRETLSTFSVSFKDADFDESSSANALAHYIHSHHHTFTLSPLEAKQLIYDLPFIYDEPFADTSAITKAFIFLKTGAHAQDVYSGEGLDEFFAGHQYYSLHSTLAKFPPQLLKILRLLPSRIKGFCGCDLAMNCDVPGPLNERAVRIASNPCFTELELKELGLVSPKQPFFDWNLLPSTLSFLEWIMLLEARSSLIDSQISIVESAATAAGVTAKLPFLDQHFVEFATHLPLYFKMGHGSNKRIIRDILSEIIPSPMTERPKKLPRSPIASWLLGPLSNILEEDLRNKSGSLYDILPAESFEKIIDKFHKTKGKNPRVNRALWTVITFEKWAKVHLS